MCVAGYSLLLHTTSCPAQKAEGCYAGWSDLSIHPIRSTPLPPTMTALHQLAAM